MLAVLTRDKCLNSVIWELILPYVCMTLYSFQSFPFSNVLVCYLCPNTRSRPPVLQLGKLGLRVVMELTSRSHSLRVWSSRAWTQIPLLSPGSGLDPRSHMEGDSSQGPLSSFLFFLESNHQDILSLPMWEGRRTRHSSRNKHKLCVVGFILTIFPWWSSPNAS